MDLPKAFIGALIGAVAALILWLVISVALSYDLTVFVIALGAAAGFGVRYVTKGVQEPAYGVAAVLVTLGGIIIGNYLVTFLVTERRVAAAAGKVEAFTDDAMIAREAKTITSQKVRTGAKLNWPSGKSLTVAKASADYPPDIAQEATKIWESKGSKDQLKDAAKTQEIDTQKGIVRAQRQNAFSESFGLLNLLWTLIALGGAFFLGFGSTPKEGGEDEVGGYSDDGTGLIRAHDAD